jgi:flagellar basal-body rod protein FlgC
MSGPFNSLSVPASGMTTMKTWIDAIADNVANVNNITSTDEPGFTSHTVVARSVPGASGGIGNGVRVAGVRNSAETGELVYMPDHPLADDDGLVRRSNVDLADQMTSLIVAQRAYQANVTVFERARDSYLRALEIGKS